MAEAFEAAVEDGLHLSKRVYFGKDRAVAPPKPPTAMERAAGYSYLPKSPMLYAVITNPAIVDNPDMPSYQPHVHGSCDPPALIPLQMNGVSLEVDCFLDMAFVTLSGTWRVHCVMGSRSCDCRIAVPMGEQGSILGVEVEVPRKSYCTQLVAMDNEKGTEKVAKIEDGGFLKSRIYTLTIPQIDGGTNISVKLRWSQKLLYHDGEFTLNIPFSFPEYVTPAAKKISKRENIQLNVSAGPGTEVMCKTTTHPLKERLRQAGKLGFLYDSEVLSWSSSDFVFTYTVSSSHTFGGVLLNPPLVHDVDRRDMFCCYLFPGKQQSVKVFRREVVFVVDISGSMKGKPLEDTKNALSAALAKLDPKDLFNVIAFNGETYLFSSSLEPATAEVVEKVTQWINMNFVAGGGTNILLPLNQAIKMLSDSCNSIPVVLLITDGAVEDERHICDTMKSLLTNHKNVCPRIYTLGIGTFCNHYFLRMLANIGRGHHDVASDVDSIEVRIGGLFARASSMFLANIAFENIDQLDDFEVVKEAWGHPTGCFGMRSLQHKLNRVKRRLKIWNHQTFGNVFDRVRLADEAVSVAQAVYDSDPSPTHRAELHRCVAEYELRLKMEEDFWRQKAAVKWAVEGERNTKFFHGFVKQKRCRARIHSIDDDGVTITQDSEIRKSAAQFFQSLLTSDLEYLTPPVDEFFPRLPDSVDLDGLCAMPTAQEVRDAVFGIDPSSVSGPDGFSSLFFQHCWDFVRSDVEDAVVDFFSGNPMPSTFTATSLVLIPKVPHPRKWTEFRPISLCNVTNKIISKIMNARLVSILPLIVSPNQSGFTPGRVISDNILLAQELIHDISLATDIPNVVMKLDMAKAYDRVQWDFLYTAMIHMGFPVRWIDMVGSCIEHCGFSVLVNGIPSGYFPSTRGLRQGDPLSPALFVLAAEYLSRGLDSTISRHRDMIYRTRRGFPVTHLAYADDVVIFTRASEDGLVTLRHFLEHYSATSGQLVSVQKSSFFLAPRYIDGWEHMVHELTGFVRDDLPMTYLGVPLFKGRMTKELFLPVIQRMLDRVAGWSHRHLSFGGRLALIRSTLMATPLHILQVMQPPKTVLQQLEQIMARFFWGSYAGQKKTHWISWDIICHPISEGGLGLRRLSDIADAFSYKLWWRLREGHSLWAQFLISKYCYNGLRSPCRASVTHNHSHQWRRLRRIGIRAQERIFWSIGSGSRVSFWDDIWLGHRPLTDHCLDRPLGHMTVDWFIRDGEWDRDRLHQVLVSRCGLPESLIEDISGVPILLGSEDIMRWMLTSHGGFSMSSAWDSLRGRNAQNLLHGAIWNDALIPTISIFLWRLLRNRLPVDIKLQARGTSLASRCWCCLNNPHSSPQVESIPHLFLMNDTVQSVWNHFLPWFDTTLPHTTDMILFLSFWRNRTHGSHTRHLSFLVPCLILWFVWTERNSVKHRQIPFLASHIIWQVERYLWILVSGRRLNPSDWSGCFPTVGFLQGSAPPQVPRRTMMVIWRAPQLPQIKLNTDGSFDPGTLIAGGGGLIRDHLGRLMLAFHSSFQAVSSFHAELLALEMGLRHARQFSLQIWIELDAAAVVTTITSGGLGSWQVQHTLTHIRNMLRDLRYSISHIHREGNRPADHLAALGAAALGSHIVDEGTASHHLLALIRMDQLGYPSFRFS